MGHVTLTTPILGVVCDFDIRAKFDDSSFSHSRDITGAGPQKFTSIAEDQRDALYQLKCCQSLYELCKQITCQPEEQLSATDTFYSATGIVLYTHHYNRLNCCTESMRWFASHTCNSEVSRTCDKQTSTTNQR